MTMFPLNFESLNLTNMPTTASSLFSAYASLTAFIMLVRSIVDQLIPHELRYYIYSAFGRLFTPRPSDLTLIVDECCGMVQNQIYEAAEVYLRTKVSPLNDRLRVKKAPRQKNITVTIEKGEEIKDSFDGININWRFVCSGGENEQNSHAQQKRQFELTVNKKHRVKVIESYLPYVLDRAEAIKNEDKVVKLYSQEGSYDPYDDESNSDWSSINLDHPATLETLAVDAEVKRTIIEDLDRFLRRREFYKKVGKAWKRGYLLYGPPGTGKSSLIAAMANYLKFDIYDVELTSIKDNSELRRTLLTTTNRSILVIEDIDCSVEVQNRECEVEDHQPSNTKLTLSGLLNFIDGLWSSCGDERIIVFTTNHKHKIDPALLRPGRMDVHIHMSYCTPSGFRILASNYLGMHESNPHRLCGEVEELIESSKVTPAEIAEQLMKSEDADVALERLVDFLKRKKEESNKIGDEGTSKSEIQETDQNAEKWSSVSSDDELKSSLSDAQV
ncbi:AAA-ATPase At2g18193 [Rosa chinensis]|nr:AAA-ATPase At2g18193 [Rosa chinensis]